MKLSTREDIDAPLDTVFEAVTNFDGFERQLLRRGIDVTRDDRQPTDVPGACWNARFPWRGRTHDLEATLVAVDEGQGYAIESRTSGIVCMTNYKIVDCAGNANVSLCSSEILYNER